MLKIVMAMVMSPFVWVGCQPKVDPAAAKKIIFGLQPNEAERDTSKFQAEVLKRTGMAMEFKKAKDYKDLIDQMSGGAVDFGFFSPLNFVEIEKKGGVKVLLKKVYGISEFYFSTIVTLEKSPLKTLKALKGKKIAFVDVNSASGYLYPHLMLHNLGLDHGSFVEVMAGTHENALHLLKDGSVDAAAVWADDASAQSGAWTPMADFAGIKVRSLTVSAPIPNDALVVREGFYNESGNEVLKFMDALISISEDTKMLKDLFGVDRLVTATSRHYETVRELDTLLNSEKK